jgi:hypothetical protein
MMSPQGVGACMDVVRYIIHNRCQSVNYMVCARGGCRALGCVKITAAMVWASERKRNGTNQICRGRKCQMEGERGRGSMGEGGWEKDLQMPLNA